MPREFALDPSRVAQVEQRADERREHHLGCDRNHAEDQVSYDRRSQVPSHQPRTVHCHDGSRMGLSPTAGSQTSILDYRGDRGIDSERTCCPEIACEEEDETRGRMRRRMRNGQKLYRDDYRRNLFVRLVSDEAVLVMVAE